METRNILHSLEAKSTILTFCASVGIVTPLAIRVSATLASGIQVIGAIAVAVAVCVRCEGGHISIA